MGSGAARHRSFLDRPERLARYPIEHEQEPLLCGKEHRVRAPDDARGQSHIRLVAAFEKVAQDIVGDAPDEGDDLVMRCLVH